MVIPGARFDDAPPPLPPPRYNEELAQGIDVAWSWGNSDPFHHKRRLAPIKPSSSLYGGYLDSKTLSSRTRDTHEMDLDNEDEHDYMRRGSNVSTVRSPSQAEIRLGGHVPTLIRKPPSPTPANQRLVSLDTLCNIGDVIYYYFFVLSVSVLPQQSKITQRGIRIDRCTPHRYCVARIVVPDTFGDMRCGGQFAAP